MIDFETCTCSQCIENLRSKDVLKDFIKFCKSRKDLRFWQALQAWSGYNKIIAGTVSIEGTYIETQRDTFYWEGKRHDDPKP